MPDSELAMQSPTADQTATLRSLRARVDSLRSEWEAKSKFGYVVIDHFLPPDFAERVLASYPPPDIEGWYKSTYIHQMKKFTIMSGFSEPIADFFALTACEPF